MERGSFPLILVHHGVFQVLRAPLVLFIEDVDQIGRSVSVNMRDHCHRGNSCIKRKFVFHFHTGTDAKIFTYAHNQTLLNHTRGRKVSPMPIKEESESLGPPQKKRKRANEEDPLGSAMNPLKVEKELKSAMKQKFKRGDEHCNADDCHSETQDAWGGDSDL